MAGHHHDCCSVCDDGDLRPDKTDPSHSFVYSFNLFITFYTKYITRDTFYAVGSSNYVSRSFIATHNAIIPLLAEEERFARWMDV